MGVILGLMERWRAYRMELFYRAAFALAVMGSVALPLSYHHLFFSYAVVYVAYALISATMGFSPGPWCSCAKLTPRRVIGCVFGLQFLALPCGFAAAKLMQWLRRGPHRRRASALCGVCCRHGACGRLRLRAAQAHPAPAFPAVAEAVPRVAGRPLP